MPHLWMGHVPHMDKSCPTYCMNESCPTCASVNVPHTGDADLTGWHEKSSPTYNAAHMNESRRTYEWITSHIYIWMSHVVHMNEWHRIFTYEWVMSYTWIHHVAHLHMNESCHTYNAAHMNESRRTFTYERVTSHICMNQVPPINESCPMYERVMSHIRYEWVMSHMCVMSHIPVTQIWRFGLLDRVSIDIYHLVQILCDHFRYLCINMCINIHHIQNFICLYIWRFSLLDMVSIDIHHLVQILCDHFPVPVFIFICIHVW